MTSLCEMILECRALGWMDRSVLYGWAAQLEEGNEAVCASKTTVADFLGVSEDTVLRCTKSLIKAGWLIDTGEHKQWKFARTPVRTINVPMIVEFWEAEEKHRRNLRHCSEAPPQKAPPQIATQGSFGFNGSRFSGLSPSVAATASHSESSVSSTDLRSVRGQPLKSVEEMTEGLKTENLTPKTGEAKPTPKPTPVPKAVKTCPKCLVPWSRDKDHKCPAWMDNDPNNFRDMPPEPQRDEFDEVFVDSKQDKAGKASQETLESTAVEGKPTPLPIPPVAPAPPILDGDEIWDERGRTRDTLAGRAWAASRGEEIQY